MQNFLTWLSQQPSLAIALAMTLAGALEYIFPPLPGDMITLFGVFLSTQAGVSAPLIFVALFFGSMAGAMITYGVGLSLARASAERQAFWLRSPRIRRAAWRTANLMRSRGTFLLVTNRFMPAVRAVLFVAAGLAELPWWRVLALGSVSALAWNSAIFAVGFSVGKNWEALLDLFQRYQRVAIVVVAVVILLAWVARRVRAFSQKSKS